MAKTRGNQKHLHPDSIKDHLKVRLIKNRWTTINGAFQQALAVPEVYDPAKALEGLKALGQAGRTQLDCVYCGDPAGTWDHVYNTVRDHRFSGYGNRIFNLVSACRSCNEKKGSKPWRKFIERFAPTPERDARIERLEAFTALTEREHFGWEQIRMRVPELAREYDELLKEVKSLITRACDCPEDTRERSATH
jgi:5-methylcytosine-specific restriction endonuclease McrA